MITRVAPRIFLVTLALALGACGGQESPAPAAAPGAGPIEAAAKPAAPAKPAPAPAAPPPATAAAKPGGPQNLDRGLLIALAQFVTENGKPVPGPARLEFLTLSDGAWHVTAIEDPDSNVFHKAMVYDGFGTPEILTLGGTRAIVKTWKKGPDGRLVPTVQWEKDFGGKFSRMRDAEVGDIYGDGKQSVAVATHDQGVVAVLRPRDDGTFEVNEIDHQPNTVVHEIELGDLDGDGVIEVYATPSAPNRLDGTPQPGEVVRYVPAKNEGRVVVAELGDRHAKEILVGDVDGDGRDELYVSVEGHVDANKQLVDPVEIRRYDADTPADQGHVIAVIDDRLSRFLTAGDVDGDGKKELVAATFSKGVWMFRPGDDPRGQWIAERIDADSAGFEHAAILADLDGDGVDELYVASDRDKELRRYTWTDGVLDRQVIYARPDNRPIFTWNLMPFPVSLVPVAP
jgi:hypothetical protein